MNKMIDFRCVKCGKWDVYESGNPAAMRNVCDTCINRMNRFPEYVTHDTHPLAVESAADELQLHAADLITEDVQSQLQRWRNAGAEIIATRDRDYASLQASHKALVDALHRAVTELEFWGKGHSDAEILIAKDALANAEKLTK